MPATNLQWYEFYITNGGTSPTDKVNLLSRKAGICADTYIATKPEIKGGGYWQESPVADGRQLGDYAYANVVDTMTFKVTGLSVPNLARHIAALDGLLIQAINYYKTTWANTPVYLIRRVRDTDNYEYALLKGFRFVGGTDYTQQPFITTFERVVATGQSVAIEHDPWQSHPPSQSSQISGAVVNSYNGRNLGNVDSSGNRQNVTENQFVSNKNVISNLTHIYRVDNSVGPAVWSSNLMNAALPYDIINGNMGDATYFGIDSTLTDASWFSNMIFDIVTPTNATALLVVWEYYSGAFTWTPIPLNQIHDENFHVAAAYWSVAGVSGIFWQQQSAPTIAVDLSTILPAPAPAVTAYWIRVVVAGVAGLVTLPQQGNRNPYSSISPYMDFQASQVQSDLTAVATHRLKSRADEGGPKATSTFIAWANRVVCGLRSTSRGLNFTPYLNAADRQNHTGVTVSLGTGVAYVTSPTSPAGRFAQWTVPAGPTGMIDIVTFTLDQSLSSEYVGTYAAFIRFIETGSLTTGDFIKVRLSISVPGGSTYVTEKNTIQVATGGYDVVSLGQVTLGSGLINGVAGEEFANMIITVQMENPTLVTGTEDIYDLILMPVDEWSGDFTDNTLSDESALQEGMDLSIDGIKNPKVTTRALIKDTGTDVIQSSWQSNTNGKPILQPNERQRLWFFHMRADFAIGTWSGHPWIVSSGSTSSFNRYVDIRGDRI